MIEEELKNDYFNSFIRNAITDLENNGKCYVFFENQVEEILKVFPDAKVIENECGYTIVEE